MAPSASIVALGVVIVTLAAATHGCGRTSLDDGFGDAGAGTGGATTVGGTGGMRGDGGQGGVGIGSIIPCGNSACVVGSQSCCGRVVNNALVETCIPVTDPNGCGGGGVVCTGDVACPSAAPKCCIALGTVGLCLPAGITCPRLGP